MVPFLAGCPTNLRTVTIADCSVAGAPNASPGLETSESTRTEHDQSSMKGPDQIGVKISFKGRF
jgi:hypothetical protein